MSDRFDDAIVSYVRRNYGTLIGAATAKESNMRWVAHFGNELTEMTIKGEIAQVYLGVFLLTVTKFSFTEPLAGIIEAVKAALEKTPPELASDVAERGV